MTLNLYLFSIHNSHREITEQKYNFSVLMRSIIIAIKHKKRTEIIDRKLLSNAIEY